MNEPSPSKRAKYISSSSNPHAPIEAPKYSFCESVTATGSSPWHLRLLDETGPHYTGGITTESLCGLIQPRGVERGLGGWDLKVKITEHHLGHTCRRCVAKYREQTAT